MDHSTSNYEDRRGMAGPGELAVDDSASSDIRKFLHISEDSIEFLRKTVTEDPANWRDGSFTSKKCQSLLVSFMRSLTLVW